MTHDSTDNKEALLKQIFHLSESNNAHQEADEKLTQSVMKNIHREIWLRNILSIASIALIAGYILLQAIPWLNSFDPNLILYSNDANQMALITDSAFFYPAMLLLFGLFIPYLFDRISQ